MRLALVLALSTVLPLAAANAVSGAPAGGRLVRRAARIAQRSRGDLIGVHVIDGSGLVDPAVGEVDTVAEQRRLLEQLGGEYRRVTSNDIATALVEVARSENATQIVLGTSKRSRWQELVNGSVIEQVRNRIPIRCCQCVCMLFCMFECRSNFNSDALEKLFVSMGKGSVLSKYSDHSDLPILPAKRSTQAIPDRRTFCSN